jgi:hypothetical protein
MTPSPSRHGAIHGPTSSIGVITVRPRASRWKIPVEALIAVVLLGFALLFHLWRWQPEGTWVVESPATAAPPFGSGYGGSTATTGTLRLDPSGRYRLETTGSGGLAHREEGYWAATLDGFELHPLPWKLGRYGTFAVPVAHSNADGTAELTFLDGRSLVLRRADGN